MKRYFPIIIITSFILLIGLLIIKGTKPEILFIGSSLPNINFIASDSTSTQIESNSRTTVIVLFNKDCPHCEYQFNIIKDNIKEFENTSFYLLTSDKDYFKTEYYNEVPYIPKNKVVFGIINIDTFQNEFGTTATPATFIFTSDNKLTNKIIGEVKLEKLLELINKSGKPESRTSG